MSKNPFFRKVLSALIVTSIAFILLNITFLLFAGFSNLFKTVPSEGNVPFGHPSNNAVRLLLFLIVIALISLFVLRSKLNLHFKAAFLTVPIATFLAFIGIALSQSPVILYLAGGLFTILVLSYLYKANQPWIYYFAVLLVAGALLIMGLTGTEM